MEMRYTKITLNNILNIATIVVALIAALATIGGGIMDKFIAAGCSPGDFSCPVWMYILFVILVTGGCVLVIFTIPITADILLALSKLGKKIAVKIINRPFWLSYKIRRIGNDVFIEVRNNELFLDVMRLSIGTHFAYRSKPVNESIKWVRQFSFEGQTATISSRGLERLHFATIDDGKQEFVVHLESQDYAFPFAFGGIRNFPLYMNGTSSAPDNKLRHNIKGSMSINQYQRESGEIYFRIVYVVSV